MKKNIAIFLYTLLFCSTYGVDSEDHQTEEIKVMAFNIKKFGLKKLGNTEVMNNIVKIISSFDISCIQEIVDASEKVPEVLLQELNNFTNNQYESVVSDRTGRSSNKEQYACYYNKSKVFVTDYYTYHDRNDSFERDPFVVEFKTNNFTFSIVICHVKPSHVVSELHELYFVIGEVAEKNGHENVIAMGDFNLDCSYISDSELKLLPIYNDDDQFEWIINTTADTTTGKTDCAYDRIVLSGDKIREYKANSSGVYRFDTALNLSVNETAAVSDHYPVYFTFNVPKAKPIYVIFVTSIRGLDLVGVYTPIENKTLDEIMPIV